MLHIALLGRYDVRRNDEPLDLSLRPVQLLLAYLLLQCGKSQRREQLAGILWPDYTDASARKNLRNTIYRLRQITGEDYLLTDRSTVAFNSAAPFRLDLAQFEESASAESVEERIHAVSLYQGELLPGFYEDWILWERERLQAVFERTMQSLLQSLNAEGRWNESLTWAEHWIAQGQTPEPAYWTLMTAHAALGDQASMVKAYNRSRQALEEALGVQPAAETERLYQELLAGAGERLPTMVEPVPPAAEEAQRAPPQYQLPRSGTSFIGRQRELAQLQQLLSRESSGRLVTIVGPGGIGKTRLSLEVASLSAEAFADGLFFVRLAPLTDPQQIVTAISETVGFRNFAGGDPRQGLLDYLQHKQLLLVIDNFEHMLAGANLVANILQHAGLVKILSTSRERLNLSSETVYLLSGLDYPADPRLPGDEVTQFGAAQLLLDRARLAQPGLEVDRDALPAVARICRLVQGMPLALVLAAGWLELLTFEEVAAEIAISLDILESEARDMPERQRSVRAAFDYSWQRLGANDQQAFSRLAVFRGGFSRRAAQQVAGAGLRTLRTLLEKSLITAEGSDRYTVHELLRQFAEEKLEAAGQDGPIRDAHSRYYFEAVAQREVDLKGRRQLQALQEIEVDLDNVRAAWLWAIERGDERGINQALESLSLFFYMRTRTAEGYALFQQALQPQALDRPRGDTSRRFWGRLTARLGLLQSQFAKSAPEIEEAVRKNLAMAEANDDETELAYSHLALGHYYSRVSGDYRQALNHFEQSLKLYRRLGDLYYVAHTLHRIGYCHGNATGNEKFTRYTRQSLQLARQIGDLSDASIALGNLGSNSFADGDYAGAESYFREAITLSQQMGNRQALAQALIQLGLKQTLSGRLEEAQELAVEGMVIAKDVVYTLSQVYGLAVMSLCASLDSDYEAGRRLAAESKELFTNHFGNFLRLWAQATTLVGLGQTERAWQQTRVALGIAYRWRWNAVITWPLPVLGVILAKQGHAERAVEILGLYFNHPLKPSGWAEKWPLQSKWREQLKESLGEDRYQAAWEQGQSLDLLATVETFLPEGEEALS